jgi:hypothetical protein
VALQNEKIKLVQIVNMIRTIFSIVITALLMLGCEVVNAQFEIDNNGDFSYIGAHLNLDDEEIAGGLVNQSDFEERAKQDFHKYKLTSVLDLEKYQFEALSNEIVEKRIAISYSPDLIEFSLKTGVQKAEYGVEIYILRQNKIIGSTSTMNRRSRHWKDQSLVVCYSSYEQPDELVIRISALSLKSPKKKAIPADLWLRDITATDYSGGQELSALVQ